MNFRALKNAAAVCALASFAAACASQESVVSVPPNAGIYKVGKPYQIEGTWYYPKEQPDYDETGIASWYGPTFYGKATANGEVFDADALTAAHRTLPMPVNVRVTNLDNGKSVVVRVNDRGPYAKGRIIDVSQRAAKLLGFYGQGTARVRVTYAGRADIDGVPVDSTSAEIASAVPAAPPSSKVATTALDIAPGAVVEPPVASNQLPTVVATNPLPPPSQPIGDVTQVPVPAVTHLYVQVGAFSTLDNANRLKLRLSAAGDVEISPIDRNGQRLYRVRMGPFDKTEQADAALARLTGLGSNDAQIVVDR
ncbi:MAG: septal ring lytic transglycosylase RlpA family protein [Proteobacteria bacterium]|nr:septal ring lytic transglycosylase RlpA family protein [Pseudomonadota bacterium]